ncbi:MAG: hypothetical protein GWM88_14240 [Pseudomonadales bacterium]|nr:hypothetical protein [Pseudomonadales bacterium]NIX09101.1 hypothetical protein [Pseudomonadales bacterium]
MKTLLYLVGSLAILVVLIYVSQLVASESAEVVVLTSQGLDGEQDTRLWVVDLDGVQYLRASPDSGWYQRLVADPAVLLVRDGTRAAYRAEVRMAVADDVNRLMREKYDWRDAYIDFLIGGRDEAVPVALIPN